MNDHPKPITPEFVRGVQWTIDTLTSLSDAEHTHPATSNALDLAVERLSERIPVVDPLAAAKERLGAWLAAETCRSWNKSLTRTGDSPWRTCVSVNSYDPLKPHGTGYGKDSDDWVGAINAALDSAERSEKP